jgi:two-component system phosphate regulon response regulator OmpR
MPHRFISATDKPVQVLVIDDDAEFAWMVVELLWQADMQAWHAETAAAGLAELDRRSPDVLLLDVMLPDADGFEVCRQLRAAGRDLTILMLTARGDPVDRVRGLEIGADDYLGKPFEPRELVARVRVLARRARKTQAQVQAVAQAQASAEPPSQLLFDGLSIDLLTRRVSAGGVPIALSTIEFKLLAALAAQPGQPLSRETLARAVQPGSYMPQDRAVDVQVARLRKKLRAAMDGDDWIHTSRGEGYMFIPAAR